MEYSIRKIKKEEYPLLENFLYEAIFLREGVEPPSREILKLPELKMYIEDFGKEGDECLLAIAEGRAAGAVWTRFIKDYGYIDDSIPSLSISLYKGYRGMGIGTALMKEMLLFLKEKGYQGVSLSVQKDNYAYKMYEKLGFRIFREDKEDYIMLQDL